MKRAAPSRRPFSDLPWPLKREARAGSDPSGPQVQRDRSGERAKSALVKGRSAPCVRRTPASSHEHRLESSCPWFGSSASCRAARSCRERGDSRPRSPLRACAVGDPAALADSPPCGVGRVSSAVGWATEFARGAQEPSWLGENACPLRVSAPMSGTGG